MFSPVCFLSRYEGNLVLKINNFIGGTDYLGGYKTVYWYKENRPEDLFYFRSRQNKIIIPDLSTGYYVFFTENPLTLQRSDKISVYFQNDPIEFEINRLWKSAKIEETDYATDLKQDLIDRKTEDPEINLLYLLYQIYEGIKDREYFEEEIFYKLFVWQENYHNLEMSNMNRFGVAGMSKFRTLPKPIIIADDRIDTVKIYKVINGRSQFFRTDRAPDFPYTLELEEGFYEINLYKDNELIVSFKHVRASDGYLKRLWTAGVNSLQEYEDAVGDNMITSAELIDLTTDEIRSYKEELRFTPRNPIFPRIIVKESSIYREVQLFVKGVTLAANSHRGFFISGKDVDFLEEDNNQYFPVAGNYDEFTVRFDPATNLIANEALLYIADEDGNIVSRITRCLFDEDPTTSLVDYYKKIRDAEVKVVLDRIHKHILSVYPQGLEFFDAISYLAQEDETVDLDNVYESLLNLIVSQRSDLDKDLLSYEIMKDWLSNSLYDSSFFKDGGLTWHPYTYSLVTQESESGYILCIMACYEGEDAYHKHYVKSKEEGSTEVILNSFGRYFVWAIDERDYTYSGFLYLNTVNRYRRSYCLEMVVE